MNFRPMRRSRQALSPERCADILHRGSSGVLAVSGDGGYPYAVPLSYVYDGTRILFHCAKTGHKLDAIAQSDKVSFCVIDQDEVAPEKYTTLYRSVIAFGRARLLTDEAEARAALWLLSAKYDNGDEAGRRAEIEQGFDRMYMVEVVIDHMTGKEAIELLHT
ncbi:MAG: pyridoxamine 5'-phosphate oxidase family protein [Oscillospiraceae bacterium]|nr:pyridoxamine 5'-phosphate oxidase family protein [Oscillospiraceae bacterium]